jgi:outer membrane protein assembly factor BamB
MDWSFTTGGAVQSSPAVAGGTVYIASLDGNVYALSAATGAKLWNFTTGNQVISSPAVAGGTVYIGSEDHDVYALNAVTGAKQWNFTTGSQVIASYGPAHRWSDRIAGRPLVRIEGAHR